MTDEVTLLKDLVRRLAHELEEREWELDDRFSYTKYDCRACNGGGRPHYPNPLEHAEGCSLKALLDEASRATRIE
jgi:hypothetical protein